MKKVFDKYVAQSTKGQIVSLAVAFLVLVAVGGLVGKAVATSANDDNLGDFGRPEAWGFMQCVDGGFVQATIRNNTQFEGDKVKAPAPISVILLSLGFWLGGMILVSFFTGVATDFLNSRREKILAGGVDYAFKKDYILIVGFDFQVKNLIRSLMRERRDVDIVLITDSSVEAIHDEILPDLEPNEARRLYVMRKNIAAAETYANLVITGAEQIYLIGDGNSVGRDGRTLQALDEITNKAKSENPGDVLRPVKIYLHIEDSALYSRIRAVALPPDECKFFDLDVYNYYESWAWECWSRKDSKDTDGASYLPIRHRPGTDRTELFIIGAGRMGQAMANFALPLINYGESGKNSRVTIFDADPLKKGLLPEKEVLEALPETEVRFFPLEGCCEEANEIMLSVAKRADTSVTVVVALSDPGMAIRAYSELSNQMRRFPVSILLWQATSSKNCPAKKYLRMGGVDSLADKTELRYFGMTDILPWKNTARYEYGKAVAYYYDQFVEWAEPRSRVRSNHPRSGDPNFISHAVQIWNADAAAASWLKMKRWKKWSSINSGDTFREKSCLGDMSDYAVLAERILRAEHNRWWTERLLAGWVFAPQRNDAELEHWDMVKFENLLDETKEIDKINIAAMAACGFLK